MKFLIVGVLALVAVSQARTDQVFLGFPSYLNGGDSRIVGGDEVVPHSRPFQVGLIMTMPNGGQAFCGGSLIDEQWVLTAAHCADGMKQIEVILGAHEVRNKNETTQQRIISTDFHVHEHWNSILLINDIALIKLPQKAQLNEFVATIAIPEREDPNHLKGIQATVSGWGKTADSDTGISPVLRKVSSKILSNLECDAEFLPMPIIIKRTQICMTGKGLKSSCNGDSGGPMTCTIDGKEVVVGCVSFGTNTCERGFPSVFTRVDNYLDWIKKTMKK